LSSKKVKLGEYFFIIIVFTHDGTYCIMDEIIKKMDNIIITLFFIHLCNAMVTVSYDALVTVSYNALITVSYNALVTVPYNSLVTVSYNALVTVSYNALVTVSYITLVTVSYNALQWIGQCVVLCTVTDYPMYYWFSALFDTILQCMTWCTDFCVTVYLVLCHIVYWQLPRSSDYVTQCTGT